MQLTSPAFQGGGMIPQKYGLDFENVNPPLIITGVPEGAKSLVLFVDDPDIPASVGIPEYRVDLAPEDKICEG